MWKHQTRDLILKTACGDPLNRSIRTIACSGVQIVVERSVRKPIIHLVNCTANLASLAFRTDYHF